VAQAFEINDANSKISAAAATEVKHFWAEQGVPFV